MYDAVVYAGIPQALEHLCAAGCRLIVATAKPHSFRPPDPGALRSGAALRGHSRCRAGRHGNDAKTDLIAHILAAHKLDAKTAIMVGDRKIDVAAATSNGIARSA